MFYAFLKIEATKTTEYLKATRLLLETFYSVQHQMTASNENFPKHRKAFEYTIIVIHEFLSLINGLEIYARECLRKTAFLQSCFHEQN